MISAQHSIWKVCPYGVIFGRDLNYSTCPILLLRCPRMTDCRKPGSAITIPPSHPPHAYSSLHLAWFQTAERGYEQLYSNCFREYYFVSDNWWVLPSLRCSSLLDGRCRISVLYSWLRHWKLFQPWGTTIFRHSYECTFECIRGEFYFSNWDVTVY